MTNSKVTPIESKQPAPAARFTITCALDGFPITIEVEGKADSLRAMIGRLKAIGAEPPQITPSVTTAKESKSVPVCPVHGSPMKASRKSGSFFCPKQLDDGAYCPSKA